MLASSRKFAEWLYGGHQPRDVAWAVSLGILAGFLTGRNGSWPVLLLAAIAFNIHTRLFLCVWSASAVAAWLARGTLEAIGRFLLDETAAGHALVHQDDGLMVPLLGWNQYAVIGGLALGSLIALLAGALFYRITCRLNRRWYATPPQPPAGAAAATGDDPSPLTPVLACLWYGPSNRERAFRREASPRRLRRGGVSSALAAALALAIVGWSLAQHQAEHTLWKLLSDCNIGDVAAEKCELSLWTGRFAMERLRFCQPDSAGLGQLYVEAAHGTLSPGLLLRGYLNIDNLSLHGIRSDAARRIPRPNGKGAADRSDAGVFVEREHELVLNHHVRRWDSFCRQLSVLEQVVAAISHLPEAEQQAPTAACAHCQLKLARPRVEIGKLRADDLEKGWNLGRKALLQINHLSSRPELASHPAKLKLVLPKIGAEIEIAFNAAGAEPHAVRCCVCNLDLPQVVDAPYVSRAVCFHAGRARLTGEGACDSRGIQLRFAAEIESLQADVSSDERLLGIEPGTWQAGLARLGRLQTELTLAGPWAAPSLTLDRRELVDGFQRQLQVAGATDLLAAVGAQVASRQNRPQSPLVVQASALDAQVTANPPGFCDFSDDALPEPESEPLSETADAIERLPAEPAEQQSVIYPTTESEPTLDRPFGERAAPPPPPVRRSLPGPRNMSIGHDPDGAVFATGVGGRSAPDGARENVLSRLSRAWRAKFSRPAADDTTNDEPPGAPAEMEPAPPREPVSAAASEAWYNRRWR